MNKENRIADCEGSISPVVCYIALIYRVVYVRNHPDEVTPRSHVGNRYELADSKSPSCPYVQSGDVDAGQQVIARSYIDTRCGQADISYRGVCQSGAQVANLEADGSASVVSTN